MVATMTNLLRNMRIVGDVGSAGTGPRVARFVRDAASKTGPTAAYAAWLGTKTGSTASVTMDVNRDAQAGEPAVLVRLSGNSTTGTQLALPVQDGKVFEFS